MNIRCTGRRIGRWCGVTNASVGNDSRSRSVHGLRGLCRGVSRREQPADRRTRPGGHGTYSSVDSSGALLGRRVSEHSSALHAGHVPAMRRGSMRARVPSQCDLSHSRRPERAGLQPLRRHTVLREQLPLHRPLFHVVYAGVAQPAQRAAQPRRVRPDGRHHGEMHVLRASHPPRPGHRQR